LEQRQLELQQLVEVGQQFQRLPGRQWSRLV